MLITSHPNPSFFLCCIFVALYSHQNDIVKDEIVKCKRARDQAIGYPNEIIGEVFNVNCEL